MDIRTLRCLVELSDSGTLSKAAERLFVSRQAVAKTLHCAERQAGERLFERHGNTLVPTGRGKALIDEARPVLVAFDELCEHHLQAWECAGPEPTKQILSLALVTGGSEGLPPGFFERFRAREPRVLLAIEEMASDSVLRHVEDGAYDAGVVGSHPDFLAGLDYIPLCEMGVWVIVPASDPLARQDRLTPHDLDGRSMVTAGSHNHLPRFVFARCEQVGAHPILAGTADASDMMRRLAEETGALMFGFPPQIHPPDGGTRVLPLDIPGAELFGTYVIRRRDARRSASASRFWAYAKASTA